MRLHPGIFGEIACAAVATSSACMFTNPMEVVKTRMQMQGELVARNQAQKVYRNALHCFYKVAADEGLRGIQSGLKAGMIYQVMMNGSRLGLYNPIKEAYGGGRGGNEAGRVLTSVAAGATTGAIGGAVGSPLFLVKARMQNAGNKAGRYSYQYAGVIDGVRQILKQEGVRGLFRGVEGSILRVMVGSSAQLSSYDTCKRYVEWSGAISGGVATHLTASLMSGLVVTTAINPFDVVSTRLFSQQVKGSEGALYKSGIMGPFDCMAKMYKAEGFAGFYKGWTAQYLRLGPHTVLTFLFWEQAKIVYDKTVLL